jgi:hypothetical protein
VATATTAVGASFKKLGASLSGVMGRGRREDGSGTDTPPQFVGDGQEGYQPPYQPPPQQATYQMPPQAASNGSGSMRNPGAAAVMADEAPSAAPAPVVQQQQPRAEAPTFTLDDNESPKR